MKALTIWQPWASLIAHGAKRVETRSWAAPAADIGTRMVIHAAKRPPDPDVIAAAPIAAAMRWVLLRADLLPLGAVVATATLTACEPMDGLTLSERFTAEERALGWYEPGRYGWRLDDVRFLTEPIPTRGKQGLWTVPADLVSRLVP